MTDYVSPVPTPAIDAAAPEPYRGIYGMPMFVRLPTADIAESATFWTVGLGFVELFAVPGRLVHLRRWAFQDALLVPSVDDGPGPSVAVSFAAVVNQLDGVAERCERLRPGCTVGPTPTGWNTIDLEVLTPEGARVTMTAALPLPVGRSATLRAEDLGHP